MADAGAKFITCILPHGKGMALLEALYGRKVLRAALGSARAPFSFRKRTWAGFAKTIHHSVEKDVLTAVVDADRADDVFAFLYEKARVGEMYGGFMFMGAVSKASPFGLPDLPGPKPQ